MLFWARLSLWFAGGMLHAPIALAADGCTDTAFLAGVLMNERQYNPENRAAAQEDFGIALGMAANSAEGLHLMDVFQSAWNSPQVAPPLRPQYIADFAITMRDKCYEEGWDE